MSLILEIAAGIVLAAIVLFLVFPWLGAIMLCLRMGDWKGAWKAFLLRLDDDDGR